MAHQHFPDIKHFYQVVKDCEKHPWIAPGPIRYRSKIKIDGTNAGIQIRKDGIFAQSREYLIGTLNDNAGFATWIEKNDAYFRAIHQTLGEVIIFGEWAGPGVRTKTSIGKIPRKFFLPFLLQFGPSDNEDTEVISEPEEIAKFLPPHSDIQVIPWYGESFMVQFNDKASMDDAAQLVNQMVAEVETSDPLVKSVWGVDDIGEGIVCYPASNRRSTFSRLMFKAKGEKHRVVGHKKPAQVDLVVTNSVTAFVELFVTEARLDQILNKVCDGKAEKTMIGPFLAEFGRDVLKESKVELEVSGLDWKSVAKPVQVTARNWFVRKVGSND